MPTDDRELPLPDLYARLAATGLVRRLLELARDEDLGPPGPSQGDATSIFTIDPSASASANIVAREPGVLAGLAALPELRDLIAPGVHLTLLAADGDAVDAPRPIATLRGPKRQLLALERPALNLLGRLSGIATTTARFVAALRAAGQTRAKLYDTRKTTPGLRVLEKYAVRCGGGACHRMGLHDAILIKDNHIAGVPPAELPAFVARAAAAARTARPDLLFIEVEVDTLDQLAALLTLPAGLIDIVLLDNMPPATLARAVAMRSAARPALQLEASGGVRLDTVAAIAATGVERISAGALTHGSTWLDLAMDIEG